MKLCTFLKERFFQHTIPTYFHYFFSLNMVTYALFLMRYHKAESLNAAVSSAAMGELIQFIEVLSLLKVVARGDVAICCCLEP